MADISLVLAFAAGVLGFLSPCIAPLIPGYLSFVSGVSLHAVDPAGRRTHRARVLGSTFLFVLGFATIFTALGASASLVGGFVLTNRVWLSRAGGIIVILLGLSVLGILPLPGLSRERRLAMVPRPGALGAFPVGMAFGFAWTPCVGPVLAAILTIAAASQGVGDGALLLLLYALGMGVPFLLTAALLTSAIDALGWVRRHGRVIETASGGFLVVMGAALLFDLIFRLNTWMLRLVPFRPAI
jgi:cytochrome c-type biogenesis protein